MHTDCCDRSYDNCRVAPNSLDLNVETINANDQTANELKLNLTTHLYRMSLTHHPSTATSHYQRTKDELKWEHKPTELTNQSNGCDAE